mgnify:CR=1 FL=1
MHNQTMLYFISTFSNVYRFDTSNTQQLYENLSSEEKLLFGFNFNDIDWDTYIKRIHIPGLRKHVLKGRGSKLWAKLEESMLVNFHGAHYFY